MLIVSGSADNTIKYWCMESEALPEKITTSKLLIKTEASLVWPVRIVIEEYEANESFLVLVICANGFLFLNQVDKIADFVADQREADSSFFDKFNFTFKVNISDTFKSILSLSTDDDESEVDSDFNCGNKSRVTYKNSILTAYIITDNNSSQNMKFFAKRWHLRKNSDNDEFEFYKFNMDDFTRRSEFLNKRYIDPLENRTQFEIISFGFK